MIRKIISLSVVEKFLLKTGWMVKDSFDQTHRLLLTHAQKDIPEDEIVYPKPTYYYHQRPTEDDVNQVLSELGRREALDHSGLLLKIAQSLESSPEGYKCKMCGRCCQRMRDAYQGLVTREEVRYWKAMGQDRILKFVREKKTADYTVFEAWINPKTGEYLKRCPWLDRQGEPGRYRYTCKIHEYKPIKCRAFPLSRIQAEYSGCLGFDEEG